MALVKVYGSSAPATSIKPSASWFVPNMSLGALAGGVLLALFIYWGWDTAVSVNEETERKSVVPGHRRRGQHHRAGRDLRADDDRRAGLPGPGLPRQQRRRRAEPARHGRVRQLHAGQAADRWPCSARRSASTLDDDPAGHAHDALHGRARGHPKASRQGEPALPDPARRAPSSTVSLSVVWYVGLTAASQNVLYDSHRRPRPDDRLLLRHHRLRGAALLPAPDPWQRQEVPAARALPAARRARPDLGA